MVFVQENTLLVFALKAEMRYVLQQVNVKKSLSLTKKRILYHVQWQNRSFFLLQTGIGPGSVRKALSSLPADVRISHIVNAGTCGSLRDDISLGDVVTPENVISEWDKTIRNPQNSSAGTMSVKTCITVGYSQNTDDFRKKMIKKYKADIVDMEAWEVLRWAEEHTIPACVIKCVSDHVGPGSPVEARQRIYQCSLKLAEVLLS